MTKHLSARALLYAVVVPMSLAGVACDDDSGSSDDGSEVADPNCDALLTPADFLDVCGMELTLEPTSFEGIELNPCNRAAPGNAALMLVSRHASPSVAMQGADVAGGRGPTNDGAGLNVSAGAASVFVVEVKVSDGTDAVCTADNAPELLDLALSRITADGG